MQFVITAVGPDNKGLADPIVHSVTDLGANIAEIQMYDHDEQSVFSMLTRIDLPDSSQADLEAAMQEVSKKTGLSVRTWSPKIRDGNRGWPSASPIEKSRHVPCWKQFTPERFVPKPR